MKGRSHGGKGQGSHLADTAISEGRRRGRRDSVDNRVRNRESQTHVRLRALSHVHDDAEDGHRKEAQGSHTRSKRSRRGAVKQLLRAGVGKRLFIA